MSSNRDKVDLDALAKLRDILDPLEEQIRARVLRWTREHYGLALADRPSASASEPSDGPADLPELIAKANPRTELERVLIVGFWFQLVQNSSELDGFRINSELKNLGHGVSNITRVFNDLMDRRPALAMQTRKSGKTKQARKSYRLTTEGVRVAKTLLEGADTSQ